MLNFWEAMADKETFQRWIWAIVIGVVIMLITFGGIIRDLL
jgi:hypothetical protein